MRTPTNQPAKPRNPHPPSTAARTPQPLRGSACGLGGYSCAIPRIAPHRECYATLQERRHVKRKEGDAVINLLVSVPEKVRLSLPVRILRLELGDELHFAALAPWSVKISAACSRQPFIPASSAPPETIRGRLGGASVSSSPPLNAAMLLYAMRMVGK